MALVFSPLKENLKGNKKFRELALTIPFWMII